MSSKLRVYKEDATNATVSGTQVTPRKDIFHPPAELYQLHRSCLRGLSKVEA
jgi:hypothetical protein